MTLKALVYSIRKQLVSSAAVSIQPSHAYELLAAAYGFNSYAALCAEHLFIERSQSTAAPVLHIDRLRQRSVGLRLDPDRIVPVLESVLDAAQIVPVNISTLDTTMPDEAAADSVSPLLLDGLDAAAKRGNPHAHRLLAGLYSASGVDEGSAYWYKQQQAGKLLSGAQAEWADNHARLLEYASKRAHHVREAARLGLHWALLELAEETGDPAFFERGFRETENDAEDVARIAEKLGRDADAHYWYTVAAKDGNVGAMAALVRHYDLNNPLQRWTWIYLAQHLGTDFLEDDYHAIHDDGSDYDDDAGGAVWVAGEPAVEAEPLDAERDRAAREAARLLLQSLPDTDAWEDEHSHVYTD
jgi:hypothetical protein